MSYCLRVFLVDLEQVRAALGGGDPDLAASVMEYHPEPFQEHDPAAGLSPRDALSELLAGKLTEPNSAHQYARALRELCDYLGDELDGWSDIRWSVMEATGLGPLLEESGSPVALPTNPGRYPLVGYIPRDRVAATLPRPQQSSTGAEPDRTAFSKDYEEWLETARQEARDLVFFYE